MFFKRYIWYRKVILFVSVFYIFLIFPKFVNIYYITYYITYYMRLHGYYSQSKPLSQNHYLVRNIENNMKYMYIRFILISRCYSY